MTIESIDPQREPLHVSTCARRIWPGIALAFAMSAQSAAASQLIAPSVGTPDSAMGGATVATPLTATAAAFSNPAALTGLDPGWNSIAIALPNGHMEVDAPLGPNASYETSSDFLAYAPEGGFVRKLESDFGFLPKGLFYGFAAYGSMGSTFNSNAAPEFGYPFTNDFFSTAGVSNFAFMSAMPIGEKLSIGVELSAVAGQSKLRTLSGRPPLDFTPLAFTVRGGGLQGMIGLRYQPIPAVAFGAGIRLPGKLWSSGDNGPAPHEDVELDLKLPTQVFLGVNSDLAMPGETTRRLHLGLALRWSDTSVFGESTYDFENPAIKDFEFIPHANDEYRIAAAMAYDILPTVTLRLSGSYADNIVPPGSVTALLFDSGEWKIGAGLSWAITDRFILDLAFGENPTGTRHPDAADGAALPGRYSLGGQTYMFGFRWQPETEGCRLGG